MAANALILQIQTKKIKLKKFFYSRKVLGNISPKYPCGRGPQSAKHLLVKCCLGSQEKDEVCKEDKKKMVLGKISEEEMLTNPKFVKKTNQFIK